MKKGKFDFRNALKENGWNDDVESDCAPDYACFENWPFEVDYNHRARIYVAMDHRHISSCGKLGIAWIEVDQGDGHSEYPMTFFYDRDLRNMLLAIEMVEDHLLKIGIPFMDDYEFHGKNRANKKRRNDSLIRKLHIHEMEKRAWEALHEKTEEDEK